MAQQEQLNLELEQKNRWTPEQLSKLKTEEIPLFGAIVDMHSVQKAAAIKMLEAILKKDFKTEFELENFKHLYPDACERMPRLLQAHERYLKDLREKEEKTRGGLHGLITVNAKPGVTGEQLVGMMPDLVKRKAIRSLDTLLYTVEHRWKDDQPTGAHLHFYLIRDPDVGQQSKPNKIKEAFAATFKDVCDVTNPHDLNMKPWKKTAEGYRKYVEGTKKDDDKERKIELDKKWLEKHGLRHAQPLILPQSENEG